MLRNALLLLLIAAPLAPARAQRAQADFVVRNAVIWTGGGVTRSAEALAVLDGKFLVVGDNAVIDEHVGERTIVIDAKGRRILPGIVDAHVHLASAAEYHTGLSLRDAASREDLLARVKEHGATLDADEWLIGSRWSSESWPDQRPPTPDEIDEAAGGRKAILVRMDGHMLIAGRSALHAANITKEGPTDPPGGKIGRDANGEPTGALYEGAMRLVYDLLPPPDDATMRRKMLVAQREAHSRGITQVGAIDSRWLIEHVLAPMDRDGELTLRVRATVSEPTNDLNAWRNIVAWIVNNRQPSPNVRVLGIKGYMDGSLGARTAWQFEPYLDDPGNHGMPLAMAESGDLRDLILFAAQFGLQPAVHAIGERANKTLLDWYELLPPPVRRDIRPRVEHAQHVRSEDIVRFAPLNVIASMQPLHKADDGRYAHERLCAARLDTSYAFRSFRDNMAVLAFGSDWPVVSCDPFLGIHAAVTGITLDGARFVPEQSLTVEEAVLAYTRGAAYALFSERDTTLITPGYPADFIILDRDVLSIPADDIKRVRVLRTVVGGKTVYEAE